MDISAVIAERKKVFDDFLHSYLDSLGIDSGIIDAFAYSLTAGGKRIRPILTMLAHETLGGDPRETLPAGLAIEMIHTFSLIHDDLPALDNDALRRGQPTCHTRFGEATAILAGDALIFQALSVIGSADYSIDVKVDLFKAVADVCGTSGLVQGEYQDVVSEGKSLSLEQIQDIYTKKTARLFELCLYTGSRIATGDPGKIRPLVQYGTYLGLAFQAIDDILDVTSTDTVLGKTSGKDLLQDKATIVKALGIDEARAWARHMTGSAIECLGQIGDKHSTVLEELARSMVQRVM